MDCKNDLKNINKFMQLCNILNEITKKYSFTHKETLNKLPNKYITAILNKFSKK